MVDEDLLSEYKDQMEKIVGRNTFTEDQISNAVELFASDSTVTEDTKLEFMIDFLYNNFSPNEQMNESDEGAVGYDIPLESRANVLTKKDASDLWEQFQQILPNADPIYLRNQARVLAQRPQEDIETFLQNAVENSDYPTMKDYIRNKSVAAELAAYTDCFNVDEYLEKIPDPVEQFSNPERRSVFANAPTTDIHYAKTFLYNQFSFVRKVDIDRVFASLGRDLVRVNNKLKSFPKSFRTPRRPIELEDCENIPLLQEIAFLRHENAIKETLKQRKDHFSLALKEAETDGLLETCGCCLDERVIPEECYFCSEGCIFCRDCVKNGAKVAIGLGETDFPCLGNCTGQFSYYSLQMVLDRNIFEKVCQRRQREEIRKANIDGLENCPFCDFSMIPIEGDKIFKCGNEECLKESCRECWRVSHIPLRCNEYEEDEDVKIRTFIENKMTEARVRECWKCHKKFYKESGCNKMTCTCGAKMCYLCGAAVNDYAHFHRTGGCPLYTDDLQQYHFDKLLQAVTVAKRELGVDVDPNKLRIDPAEGLTINDV